MLEEVGELGLNEYLSSKFGYGKLILFYIWVTEKAFGANLIGIKILPALISLLSVFYVFKASKLIANNLQLSSFIAGNFSLLFVLAE